jgi:5-methylcytosine-specific restriction protein A
MKQPRPLRDQLYGSRKWKRLRWSVLVRDRFTCAFCKSLETDTSRLVCDHVTPWRGDQGAFWSGPFQTVCKPCHDGEKQSADKGGNRKRRTIGLDGWPV